MMNEWLTFHSAFFKCYIIFIIEICNKNAHKSNVIPPDNLEQIMNDLKIESHKFAQR